MVIVSGSTDRPNASTFGQRSHLGTVRFPEAILRRLSGPSLLIAVAIVYAALAQFVIWLNDPVQLGAGFWPAAGVSLALLVILDRKMWPWVLAGVAVGELSGDLFHGYSLGAIGFWTLGNVVEPLVGAVLIRRFSSEHRSLTPLTAFVVFLAFGVIVGPLVGATIGSLGTTLFYATPPALVWPKYVVGDALGVLVVAPVLLAWSDRSASASLREAVALGFSAIAVTLLVFRNWDVAWDTTSPYLIVPFFVWAGVRFGLRGVALVGFAVANIANAATAFGYGPFAMTGGTEHAVTLMQIYLGIVLTTGLILASLRSDLTDAREAARQQAEHLAEVQRNRQFRDAFIGVLSHEIRTPITTIYGMSQALVGRRSSMDAETVGEYLDDISVESDRLRRLTEDFLVLSRADGGGLVLAADPIMLEHLVRATVTSEAARATGHNFTVEASPALPLVVGEEGYVEQVVRNFLGNASKYSPSGTTVHVALTGEGDGVAVRVIDEGPGLPAGSSPDQLFDLFYRAPDAMSTAPGAGIGLFVCRTLVEAMGGRIWATNAPGRRGAEFGFWLPARADDQWDEG